MPDSNIDENPVQNGNNSSEPTEITALKDQLKEKETKFLYLYAEFENYKKRAFKERSETLKYALEPVAADFLSVLDNLERAVLHSGTQSGAMVEGLKLVIEQFKTTLIKRGITAIATIGKPFDPHLHEALGQEPSDLPQGIISREETKGYMLHDRLIRPARVVISAGNTGNPKGN